MIRSVTKPIGRDALIPWKTGGLMRAAWTALILVSLLQHPASNAKAQATSPIVTNQTTASPAVNTIEIHSEPPHYPKDEDPAFQAMWDAVNNFGDISVSRPQLLQQFHAIVTNYPGDKYQATAKYAVEILSKMIAQDEAHAKLVPTNLSRLPIDERISELIYQLRNQNSKTWGSAWAILDDHSGNSNSPAHELLSIGYPAVPRLIEAIKNPQLSRSLRLGHQGISVFNESWSTSILTVGDCAVSVLEGIAGRSFKQTTTPETLKTAGAWWAEFQKKREKQMLIEGTEAGNGDSPAQAKLLLERYPDATLPSLIKGTRAATNVYTREFLLRFFEKFNSPEALAFLDQELREGFSVSPLVAAGILNRKGRPEGVTMVIQEWEKSCRDQPENMSGPSELERFLASVDSPDAIAALGKNLRARSLNTRMAIVGTVGGGGSEWYGPPVPKHSAATLAATEKLLVTAMQDEGQIIGENGVRAGQSYSDPRVADMAGLYLNWLWPDRYKFDVSASLKVRDSQRIECQNVWRQSHNLPAIPFPPARSQHVSPNEAAKVTVIKWEVGTVKPSHAFVASVEAFKDKLLTPTNLVNFLAKYAANPEPGTAGLELNARKDEDLTGVTLMVGLAPGTPPIPGQRCHVDLGMTLGHKGLSRRAGIGDIYFYGNDSRAWKNFIGPIAEAITGPPETPFIIRFVISEANYMAPPTTDRASTNF